MESISDYLSKESIFIVHDLRDALRANNRTVTGKTADSIENVITETSDSITLEIKADANLIRLQEGRRAGPVSIEGQESIRQWIKDKPVIAEGISENSLLFLITRKIRKEGWKGTPGLINNIINDDLVQSITDGIADVVFKNTVETIDGFAVNYNNK
jgi:hypothetical protein